jgi:hypothetical protein
MFTAAFVSFASFLLIMSHLSPEWMRRLVGYKGIVDVVLHSSILWMFLGTSTMGLLQAEAAGICFSLYLRFYYWAWGYERMTTSGWQRYAGYFTGR